MGLDMYGVSYRGNRNESTPKNFHYWRKHYDLDDWMTNLCIAKTGSCDRDIEDACMFEVELEAADLDNLERDVRAGKIKYRFEDDLADDLRFIAKARRHLAQGLRVHYWANW